jgi:putative salt-induced outer membrane protein YdiY
MKNGDRLTGVILKSDDKTLTIKSEYAGPVNLPWEAVVAITSSDAVSVGLQDGQIVVGAITGTDGKYQVATKATGAVSVAKESIKFIRSREEQIAYDAEIERYRNPKLVDLWAGFVDLGFARAQGNAKTTSLNVSANANRITTRDKMSVYFTSIYAQNSTLGKSEVTANARRGGINYSLNVSPRLFAFGSVDLEADEFQSLDLRFSPAGGLGYHIIKDEKRTFDALFGASLNREFFSNSSALNRTSGEILVGEEYIHKISDVFSVRQKMVFYPNVTDTGSYRINFDAAAVTILRKWLSWQVSISDRFLSNPVFGRQKNDALFTTGIRITFAR